MLQSKVQSYEGKVVSLKLVVASNNIIEVMGQYLGETDKMIRLGNPQLLTNHIDEATKKNKIAMLTFMISGENKIVELNKNLLLAIDVTGKQAADEFKKIQNAIVAQ